jgi:transposase
VIDPPDLKSLDSAAKDSLILALIARVDVLVAENAMLSARVTELEAKLGQPPRTPDNSSTPPSQGQKPSAVPATKPRTKAHPGAHRPLHPNPTSKRDLFANACQHCGADVSGAPQFVCEAYDHIEIPDIAPDVTRVTLYGGSCPCCAKRFKASAPADMPRGSPFGENLRALVVYLRFTQGIAFARLATLLSDLLGLDISEGALVNMLEAAREPFAAQQSAIRARLLAGTALQSDETGLRVGKTNWWLWVFHFEDSAAFVASPSRAKHVVEEFLGGFRPDYWVSDRYGGQMGFARKENQICLAHLIRGAQYAIDAGDLVFAPDFRHLLGRACRIGRNRERLKDVTLKIYQARLDKRLDELMARTPTNSEGIKLQRAIKKCRRHLFVFVANRDLPPTNNGSEQALRPCAVFRKITNGFRTEWGARLYADIRSVLETARRRAIGALDAIRLTLAGKLLPTPA